MMKFPTEWKHNSNVPNHQPAFILSESDPSYIWLSHYEISHNPRISNLIIPLSHGNIPYKIDLENKLGENDDDFWDLNKQVG